MAHVSLENLQAFVAVTETGSFNQAGRRLHLTQPSITSRIKYLESAIGVLFVRHRKRGALPTATGERLYPLAKAIVTMASCAPAVANGEMSTGQALPLAAQIIMQTTFQAHIDRMVAALDGLRGQVEATLGAPVTMVAASEQPVEASA